MELSHGEKFIKMGKQDNGEADVQASTYELDFKLLVNQDYVNNKLKSLPAVDYSTMPQGYISVKDNLNKCNVMTPAKANGLFPIFFNKLLSLTQEQIALYENDKESELYSTIKMFKKNKNLFFFLPCVIECADDNSIVNFVMRMKNIFSLRDNINKDTFVSIFRQHENRVEDEFYLLKYENGKFQIVDKVYKVFVPYFVELQQLTSSIENI